MENLNAKLDKTFEFLLYGSLWALVLGLVTSTTILSLYHICIAIPSVYFLCKVRNTHFSKSSWALLVMSIAIVLSVVFNQDIIETGFKSVWKVKYFLFGLLSIAPLSWFFKNHWSEKKFKVLIYAFCVATTIATIAGIIGMKTGFNYISWRKVGLLRNAGLSGMVLNYAHNLAFFQIILLGLIIYRKKLNEIVSNRFMVIIFVINLIGLYLSFTRGAILALIVGTPMYFFKKNKLRFFAIGGTIALIAAVIYFSTGKSILRPASDRERISQWIAASKAFQERPLLGYGYLNFERHSVDIKHRYNIGEYQFGGHAHNNFLEMLASTGILGFTAFLGWLVLWFWEMYKREDLVALICVPFITTFVVSGLTQSTISLGVNLFFIMAVFTIGQLNVKNPS